MAERRVSQVVGKGERLDEVLVEREGARDGAADLRHLDAVGEPRPKVIPLVVDENLRLVLETAKGARVDDPIAIALEGAPERVLALAPSAPRGRRGRHRIGGEVLPIDRRPDDGECRTRLVPGGRAA